MMIVRKLTCQIRQNTIIDWREAQFYCILYNTPHSDKKYGCFCNRVVFIIMTGLSSILICLVC